MILCIDGLSGDEMSIYTTFAIKAKHSTLKRQCQNFYANDLYHLNIIKCLNQIKFPPNKLVIIPNDPIYRWVLWVHV
jgi:hypothetical protein